MSVSVKRLFLVVAAAVAVLTFLQCGTKPDDPQVVARVGDKAVRVEEFRTRFSFTPHLGRYPSLEYGKQEVLASLIGEKILTQEGERLGIGREPQVERFTRQIEDEAIVEALFEEEIGSKIEVSEEELRQAYVKSKLELEVEYLTFDNTEEAVAAHKKISSGVDFRQVAREYLAFSNGDRSVAKRTIRWGQADPRLEEVAFGLRPGEVSPPVTVEGVTLLLHLVNRKTDIFTSERDFRNSRRTLEKTIRRRKKEARFAEFLHQVMAGTRLQVSGRAFAAVVEAIERATGLEERWDRGDDVRPHSIAPKNLEEVGQQLGDLLDQPLARFSDGRQWSVRQFLEKLRLGPFPLDTRTRKALIASLRLAIGRMAEIERLAEEGRRRGLQDSPAVRGEVAMWYDSRVAQELRQRLLDTVRVTPEEVESFYQRNRRKYGTPERVKLQEILVYDRRLADSLLARLRAGDDMGDLARRFSKRTATAANGGVSPYLVRNAWGKLGELAFEVEVGMLVGPVEVAKNHWSLFRVLEHSQEVVPPFEKVRGQVENDARKEKQKRVLEEFLLEARGRYPIRINRTALDSAEVIDANMWVFKTHFPGRTIAPNVYPLGRLTRWLYALRSEFGKSK